MVGLPPLPRINIPSEYIMGSQTEEVVKAYFARIYSAKATEAYANEIAQNHATNKAKEDVPIVPEVKRPIGKVPLDEYAKGMGLILSGSTALGAPPLLMHYFSKKKHLTNEKKMKQKLNNQKLDDMKKMLQNATKQTKALGYGIAGIALASVAVNRLGQGVSSRMAEGAARKTAKTKAKAEIQTAEKKADAEIRAEKEKVAAQAQGITISKEERVKGNIQHLEMKRSYSFDEIKGQDEAVKRLSEEAFRASRSKELEFLQSKLKDKPRSHILLYGPPGTGKTLGLQCFTSYCNENGLPLRTYMIDAENIEVDDVGLTLEKMTKIAAQNSKEGFKTGYVVDECDRNAEVLEGMKSYMEGPQGLNKDVLIFATTNHMEKLTGPFLNRFGPPIEYRLPNANVRREILKNQLIAYGLEVPNAQLLTQIAKDTQGYTGREFRNIAIDLRLDAENKILKNPSKMPAPGTPLKFSPEELQRAVQKLKFKVTLTNAASYSQEGMLKKANLNN